MIQLAKNIQPLDDILDALEKGQDDIDGLQHFEERSARAKALFSLRNKKGNKAFDAVKEKLTEMCSGAKRCAYCEDSAADEVEHIYPKDLYPGKCFTWDNYVYACGPCNGPKNNKFAIFRKSDGQFTEVNPPHGQPAVEPPEGAPTLINPRIEDPMQYCMLDLNGTFKFVIIVQNGTTEYKRADYTFNEVLRLNDQRESLRQARKIAYSNYKARLYYYSNEKKNGAQIEKLNKMIEGIQKEAHPTVWKEMQRYYHKGALLTIDPELHELFTASPEALTW